MNGEVFKIIIFIFFVFYAFTIFLVKDITKVKLTIFGLIFFDLGITILPVFNPLDRLWFLALFLSALLKYKQLKYEFIRNPYICTIIIFSVVFIFLSFFDHRMSFTRNLLRAFLYIVDYFGIFLLLGLFIKSRKDLIEVLKFFYYCMIVCAFYGLIVLLWRNNYYYNFFSNLYNVYNVSTDFLERKRLGVSSFIPHPHTNGLYLSFAILVRMFLNNFSNWKFSKWNVFVLILMIVVQILSNSRAAYIGFIIGLITYSILGIRNRSKLRLYLLILLVYIPSICLFVHIPSNRIINVYAISTIFEENVSKETPTKIENKLTKEEQKDEIYLEEKVDGSTFDMRKRQLILSIGLVKDKIFVGNGLRWLKEEFGFNPNDKNYKMTDGYYNFESFLYIVLVESGILGLLMWFLFYGKVIYYNTKEIISLKNNVSVIQISSLCLALFFIYLTFIYITGEIHTTPMALGLIAILTKGISLVKVDTDII
ncbi:O-antigen ligase family protein [Apibacter adventoris]|uniref:O-antigen ligase-related domain-containing protein n=1 Tax=Apibacter adventoris TaxID=1679466 RepID=A0A2S8AGT8_9FLAO|nr:O-antigen ligase family protein [Apibacter adventoris]PQL95493.1 hypothetical protein C4S77_01480 [Apibacter adventoris]